MSVFDQSFDKKVIDQLKIREQILSVVSGDDGILSSRPKGYIQYANNKTPFIRLQSGVDITSPNLKAYFNLKKDSDLAKRFILEGGTQLTAEGTGGNLLSTQRSNFIGKGGKYGAPELGGTSDLGIRPMPGINSLSIKSYGENISTLRIATISATCYDIHQLEALEVLYMRPGYRVLLEWGHTIYFDDLSSDTPNKTRQNVDVLTISPSKTTIYDNIFSNREKSAYNYDAMFAKVRNFSWEALPDGSYRCTIELISIGDIIDSLKISVPSVSKKNGGTNESSKNNAEEASNAFLGILDTIKTQSFQSISIGHSVTLKSRDIKDTLEEFDIITYTIGNQAGSSITYLKFPDLVRLINESCMYYEGEDERSIVIDYNLNYCLSHPYQISTNPKNVLISPYNLQTGITYGDPELNSDLVTNFDYRANIDENDISRNDLRGNMNNILISIDFLIDTFKGLINDDNKNEVYLKDYFNEIFKRMVLSMGGINDFRLIRKDRDDHFEIIDYNYRNAGKVGDTNAYTIPVMGLGIPNNKGSYVRDYRLSTSLTNDISTIVSIQAQAGNEGGIDGYNTSVFNAFNVGIKDRLSQPIKSSFNPDDKKGNSDNDENNKIDINILIENILSYLNKVKKYDFQLNEEESRSLSSDLQDLIQYTNHVNPIQNLNFGTHTPIPLNLSLTMDGISGLKVGNIFRLPADRLPFQYKVFNEELYGAGTFGKARVAFIVFGIDHNVDQNGWTTTLDCNMVLLKPQSKTTTNSSTTDPVKDYLEVEKQQDVELTDEEILGIQTATQQTQ